jgi:hypothetical protein
MNKARRVLLFGAVSGFLWTAAILLIDQVSLSSNRIYDAVLPGMLTGMLVSLALVRPLEKLGRVGTSILGFLSLPLGGFLFGFWGEIGERMLTSYTGPRDWYGPFVGGGICAVGAVLAFYFIPFSILTTFLLRKVVLMDQRPKEAK